jgi:hypothetical protein
LAPEEASADDTWKLAILQTESKDVVRFEVWTEILSSTSDHAYETVPRVMRTSFVEEWQCDSEHPIDSNRKSCAGRGSCSGEKPDP